MRPLEEILGLLASTQSPAEAAESLRRVLRFQALWSALGDPGVLERCLQTSPGPLTPGLVLLTASGYSRFTDLPALPDSPSESAAEGSTLRETLSRVSKLLRAGDPGSIVPELLEDPDAWSAPLACAWKELSRPAAWLARLLDDIDSGGLALAARALLANSTVEDAADALSKALGAQAQHAVAWLDRAGEHNLARLIAVRSTTGPSPANAGERIDASIGARLAGEMDAAVAHAQAAWDGAQAIVAQSADALAEAADVEGDSVTSLEARRQAVRAATTPLRRALLAVALASMGDAQSALEALPEDTDRPIEQIGRGIVLALQESHEEASGLLERGWAGIEEPARLPSALWTALAAACEAAGKTDLSLEMTSALVAAGPDDPAARLAHAERLLSGGDAQAALNEAQLAAALDPDSNEARHALAAALHATGRSTEAVEILEPQAGSDAKTMAAVAELALAAGKPDVALAWSLRLLELAPDSSTFKALHAKSLALGGAASEAVRELEDLLSDNPEDVRAWVTLAQVQAQSGDAERSGDTLTRAAQAVPGSPEIQVDLGRWFMQQQRWSEAEPHLLEGTLDAACAADALYDHATVLEALGRRDESLAEYERCARRQPGNWNARLALARLSEAAGGIEEAWHWIEALPAEAPAEAHFLAARLALRRGPSAEEARTAVGHLLRARRLGLRSPDLSLWLGQAHEAAGNVDRAVEAYAEAVEALSSEPEGLKKALLGRGRTALAGGQPAVAVASFEQLRDFEPGRSDILVWVSRSCLAAGLPSQALESARKAAEIDPASVDVLAQWVEAAVQAGETDEASSVADRLARRSPDDPSAWLRLAELSVRAGKASAAREAVARAVASARRDVASLRRGAALLSEIGDLPAAERILDTAIRQQPDDPALWIELADVRQRAGQRDSAADAWIHAADLSGGDPQVARRAGRALVSGGRTHDAVSVLQKASASRPGDRALQLDLAETHLESGDRSAAAAILREAASRTDLDPSSEIRLGRLLVLAGESTLGLPILQKAADDLPESAASLTNLAEAWLWAGRPSPALESLERAVRMPGPPAATFALLVHAYLASGDVTSAWDSLRAAGSTRPSTLPDARLAAGAHLRLGEWQSAVNTLEQYLEASGDPRVSLDLAEMYLRLQDASWLYGETGSAHRHAPAQSREQLGERCQFHLDSLPSQIGGTPKAVLARAHRAAWQSAPDEGLPALEESVRAAGSLPQAVEALAIACLRTGRAREGLLALQSIAPASLQASWQPLLAGLCHRSMGNLDLARQAFEAAQSELALAPLARSLVASLGPSTSDAIGPLNDAVAAWPNEPAWHLQLANLYLEMNDVDSALPHLQQAAELDPENGDAWLALARTLKEAGHWSEAQQAYERVVQLLPRLGQVWKEAGAVALTRADHQLASDWYARSLALNAGDVEAMIGAAQADLGLGRRHEARRRAEAAVAQDPSSAPALQCLGQVLAAEGDIDEGLVLLQRAIERSDRPGPLLAVRARLLTEKGQAGMAVEELQKALQEGEDEALWSSLADAFVALGRPDEAMQAASEAVRLSPRHSGYRVQLARICRGAGQLDRAVDQLAQAEALLPDSADLALERGQIHEERREFDRALEAYQRAAELDPRQAKAYYRAGLVYRGLKSYSQAARMFKRAVELAPDDASTLHQLAAVHALELVHGGFHPSAVTT